MKSFKLLLVLCLFAGMGLSFNIHPATQVTSSDKDPVYTQEQAEKLLEEKLINPLTGCTYGKFDHMTKCWYGFSHDFPELKNTRAKYTGIFCAEIFIEDCSAPESIGFAYINCDTKTIEVKESFRSPKVGHKEYMKSVCKFYKKGK